MVDKLKKFKQGSTKTDFIGVRTSPKVKKFIKDNNLSTTKIFESGLRDAFTIIKKQKAENAKNKSTIKPFPNKFDDMLMRRRKERRFKKKKFK